MQSPALPEDSFAPSLRAPARFFSPAWPVYALFLGFPLWWFLGLSPFIWSILGLALVPTLIMRRRLVVPRHFGIWVLFLLWVVASSMNLDWGDPGDMFTYLYRLSLYLAATSFFLYILNSPHELPTRHVVYLLTAFFAAIVLFGYLALVLPSGSFVSLVESLLPGGLKNNEYVLSLVHPEFAQVQNVLGYPFPRPTAPFQYSNQWGSTFTLLLPMVFVSLKMMKSGFWRSATLAILWLSIVPFVVSVNRGATLTLGLALVYALWRFGLRGNVKAIAAGFAVLSVVAVIVLASPLAQIISDRVTNATGTTRGREIVYSQATERIWDSPVFGYGVPLPRPPGTRLPPVGTHGQFWIVMIPAGIPALLLFFAWFVYAFWKMRGGGSVVRFWAHIVLLVALLQFQIYNYIPAQIQIIMIVAALAWRETLTERQAPVPRPAVARSPARVPVAAAAS